MEKPAVLGGKPVRKKPLGKWPIVGEEEVEAAVRVVRSVRMFASMYGGEEVPKFEEEFARALGVDHAVAVSSGTAALEIAVRAVGVDLGDEVITTPYTFIASATCILQNHGVPVFVDVDPRTRNIDPEKIEQSITDKTKAMIPVHIAGHPAEMDEIMKIADEHGLYVIEDAAQAHLAEYKGRIVGGIGHVAIFSFQESKNMASGEGGIITTNDDEIAEMCRSLREHGRVKDKPWYYHEFLGWNYRMTEMQAAILRVQLNRLRAITEERRRNAEYLTKILSEFDFVKPGYAAPYVKHAYHLYLLDYFPKIGDLDKASFVRAVSAEGIPLTGGYMWPVYKNPIFSDLSKIPKCLRLHCGSRIDYSKICCPVTERLCYETGLWFHGSILNADREELEDVPVALEKVFKHRKELKLLAEE